MLSHVKSLGIDIGGTTCRAALLDAASRILVDCKAPTPEDGQPDLLAALVRTLANCVCDGGIPFGLPIGIALPGRFDLRTTVMHKAVNLPALEGARLFEVFGATLHARTFKLMTDVMAAGAAQRAALAGDVTHAQLDRVVYLSIGTGVGGVAIIDGQVLDPLHGAGQFGHLIVNTGPDAPLCKCGLRGCLEACFSGEMVRTNGITGRALHDVTTGLLQLAQLWAPTAIILGGGVIDHHRQFVAQCREAFNARRGAIPPADLAILAAPLRSDEAGVVGAGTIARLSCTARP